MSNVIAFSAARNITPTGLALPPRPATMAYDSAAEPLRYEIFDRQTKTVVGIAKTKNGARASVDRRDNRYGGYRFGWRAIYADGSIWNGF